jgi:hypothetical protein
VRAHLLQQIGAVTSADRVRPQHRAAPRLDQWPAPADGSEEDDMVTDAESEKTAAAVLGKLPGRHEYALRIRGQLITSLYDRTPGGTLIKVGW